MPGSSGANLREDRADPGQNGEDQGSGGRNRYDTTVADDAGGGPIVALAVEAFAPAMASFKRGRDFAAWLGLVPRQHSSGGKERLGRVSKAGQADIRQLLIIGAMSRLSWLGRKSIAAGSWLDRMLARKPKMLVAIALANKMARAIWAMLTKGEDYSDPALIAAA